MTIPAYPLTWPEGWPRTNDLHRIRARFGRKGQASYGSWQTKNQLSIAQAVDRVRGELRRMNVDDEDLVISTDLRTRLDGLPYSNQREPEDPGAAVYWRDSEGETRCMAIDRYDRIADNIAAIAATLDAMRAIERHGGAEILNRAFRGFVALEHDSAEGWHEVLEIAADASTEAVREAYRVARRRAHPDTPGGTEEEFHRVQEAWERFKRERGIEA